MNLSPDAGIVIRKTGTYEVTINAQWGDSENPENFLQIGAATSSKNVAYASGSAGTGKLNQSATGYFSAEQGDRVFVGASQCGTSITDLESLEIAVLPQTSQ